MSKLLKIIFFIFLLIPSGAVAEKPSVFGPQLYIRTVGGPNIFTATFPAGIADGVLVVQNGDENGSNRVSAATITVNGVQVFGPKDFKQDTYHNEVALNLVATNTLSVELTSAPGSYLTLFIQQEQTTTPLPVVSLNALPPDIVLGGSSTLSWATEDATNCSIEPGIGIVNNSGSLAVSPKETTIYTLTASNPTGSTTHSVTVNVAYPPPTASITAAPDTIDSGGTTTLTWNTTFAESCSLEPDIGTVPTSGTMVISPTKTTSYTVTATGHGGVTSSSAKVTINPPPSPLVITSPLDNAVIQRSDIDVIGFVNNVDLKGIGITVNGVPAIIDQDRFLANHVGLVAGENIITVTLSFPDGSSAQQSITVTATPDNKYITLHDLGLESGLAPLEITLRVDGNFSFAGVPIISDSGPAPVEFLTPTEPDTFRIKMTTPGVYSFTAKVQDTNGVTFTDTLAVPVMDKNKLDIALRSQWEGMKTSLVAGDIESGLTYFISDSRQKYRGVFTRIAASLPQLIGAMEDIEMVYFENNFAKYRIHRVEEINGSPTSITYYIYFSQDSDGRYKVFKF